MPPTPLAPLRKHSPPLQEGNPSLCNAPFAPGTKVPIALRPADVTCEKCWREMLARRMVTIDDIPVTMDFKVSRKLLLELGLPVEAKRPTHAERHGLAPLTWEERKAALKQVPLSEVRRMLAVKRSTG